MSVAGKNGACCECNQLIDCECHFTVACSLGCRQKGGTAELIGFAEYCAPSDPPKRYRRKSFYGSNPIQDYGPAMCTGDPVATAEVRQSGALVYDRDTGELTDTTSFADGGGPYIPSADPCGTGGGCESTGSVEQTEMSITGNNACCNAGGSWRKAQGTRGESLSEEDTEEDAEARLMATIEDWTPCASCSVTCSAFRTDRSGTSDTVFGFRNVQTKVSWTASSQYVTLLAIAAAKCAAAADAAAAAAAAAAANAAAHGLNPALAAAAALAAANAAEKAEECAAANAAAADASTGVTYKVTVRFFRRPLGSSEPYVFFSTEERTYTYSGIMASTPAESDWLDVPNEAGWETIAAACAVERMP